MRLIKPDPPIVQKVTHSSITLDWTHVKKNLATNEKFKYSIQELSNSNKKEWGVVYSGFGTNVCLEGLEVASEHTYRLCVIGNSNEKSEYSSACTVKTTKEPLNGEVFQKAIILERKADLEKMLDLPNGHKFLEIPDKFDNLPLMITIIRNNFDLFEMFIQKGADVNIQNDGKKTPMMIACFYGRIDFIKELRRNNARYDLCDISGMSAIHYAVDGGSVNAVEYLLMDGVDINTKDKMNGWTPLLRGASINCSYEIASILLRFKADVNVLDKENKNALLIATINGNLPLVKLLVESGANFNAKNNYGKSLYELAISMDRKLIVKYYEEQLEKNAARKKT